MNSGYEGSLPAALGKRIVNINFFILIIGFSIIFIGSYIVIFFNIIGVESILAREKTKWKQDKERSWVG